ncbi:MAG: Jag N-terminal domain-containing protein [Campylobacterales bacterium]
MKKIEAPTLEEAYTQAALAFGCSVTELEVQVVQNPSSGLMGLFKKPAIIVAVAKRSAPPAAKPAAPAPIAAPERPAEPIAPAAPIETLQPPKPPRESSTDRLLSGAFDDTPPHETAQAAKNPAPKPAAPRASEPSRSSVTGDSRVDYLVDSFNHAPADTQTVCVEIEQALNGLFANTCYRINPIKVTMHDDKTVKVYFDGEDAALLIGKDGYRYKALSYILFNWINPTYGYLLRLEIAEFLQNQEEMIGRYLEPVIASIEQNGKGQTRVLDGVLVQIALKELRVRFPGKYVAIKTTPDGLGKYVVVNDFIRKYDRP